MANNLYIGPWVWDTDPTPRWRSPANGVGSIDLRNIPDQSIAGVLGDRPYGLFLINGTLPAEYTLLGSGDLREIRSSAAIKSAWLSHTGYEPQGDTVADLLVDQLTNGGDPTYQSEVGPLMPNSRGVLELWFGGQLIKSERFRLGVHLHSNKVEASLHHSYRLRQADVDAGRMSADHIRRVLDFSIEKYFLSKTDKASWELLVPPELRDGHQGPLPHETTINESFNTGDSTTLGPDLTWTELTNDFEVLSNQCNLVTNSADAEARAESDLTSVDHFCQVDLITLSNTTAAFGASARYSSSANTSYIAEGQVITGDDKVALRKVVTGTITDLGTKVTHVFSLPETLKCEIDGTTLRSLIDDVQIESITDSAISAGTRCGIHAFKTSGRTATIDAFKAEDLAAGLSIPVAQYHYHNQGIA